MTITRRSVSALPFVLAFGLAFGPALIDAASAADIPVKAPALAAAPIVDWSGVYAGVHAGYGGGMTDWNNEGFNYPAAGFLGGGQIGINKQIASLVFGLELEGSWASISGTQPLTTGSMGFFFLGTLDDKPKSRLDGMVTLAGRAGLAADRWFVFAKGGLAGVWQTHSLDRTLNDAFGFTMTNNVSGRDFRIAPLIGLGAEYALDAHWSLKAEYDYLHLSTKTVPLSGAATFNGVPAPGFVLNETITQDAIHLIKVGANYRLGPVAVDPVYPPVKAVPGTNWTGAFLGVQGGYGFGRLDRSTFADPTVPGSGTYDMKGWLGGVDGGVNVQSGAFVFGVEGEWMWTGIRGGQNFTGFDPGFNGNVATSLTSTIDWLAIASAKAGFVVGDRLLVYGKGGVAIASERHSNNSVETFQAQPDVFSIATTGRAVHTGVAIGAGAEYALGGNWSIKGEYDYIKMLPQRHTATGVLTLAGPFPDQGNIAPGFDQVRQDLHLFKLGVNYHFNPLSGAVTARY
ncbi:porin family protein [Bradyrhizobium manausense]|uniref:outer membrane protein n=1 Tax=Bradyrhizobium TaxID=374 RepID=UPI001BA7C578|nr:MULTISPECIES: outer membrane beta-barrel protein [Bradyrhizobium]MBR0830756.1 porin family protein [Bradyrhizobium manausense]UVO28704.1 outer membrane beta-barrel protein [Bradyrhizobium arachidis]